MVSREGSTLGGEESVGVGEWRRWQLPSLGARREYWMSETIIFVDFNNKNPDGFLRLNPAGMTEGLSSIDDVARQNAHPVERNGHAVRGVWR